MQNTSFIQTYRQPAFLVRHSQLLVQSYQHWTGLPLLECDAANCAQALMDLPFAVASHDLGDDPCFNYANHEALRLFKMAAEDMIGMPSRYSAEPMLREARADFLAEVAAKGFVANYQGIRIAKDGTRFLIEQATVWNVVDAQGDVSKVLGQAVKIKQCQPIIEGMQ